MSMSIDERIEDYYRQIVISTSDTNISNHSSHSIPDEEDIKRELRNIIENNREYLLTPNLIKSLTFHCDVTYDDYENGLLKELNSLTNVEEPLFMSRYVIHTYSDLDDNPSLTDYEKELFNTLFKRVSVEMFNDDITFQEYMIKRDIMIIIAAHMVFNKQDIDMFNKYVDPFMDNWESKYDEIKLQLTEDSYTISGEYKYSFEELFSYIIKQLDNNRKEIW